MLKEFIERIIDLGIREQTPEAAPQETPFILGDRLNVNIPPTPIAEPLIVHTLSGFIEAVHQAQVAEALRADSFVLVQSPYKVALVSQPLGFHHKREELIRAVCDSVVDYDAHNPGSVETADVFRPGEFMALEWFIIKMQHLFEDSDERKQLLELVGNVTDEEIRTQADDGVTQVVTKKDSVAMMKEESIKNPWLLAPYRTFREVTQPVSSWVLRVQRDTMYKQGTAAALFLADGGVWELQAIHDIVQYLSPQMPDFKVVG